jgi:hypothetical protein
MYKGNICEEAAMAQFWLRLFGARSARLDRLSPHLQRDLNLPADVAFFRAIPSEIGNFHHFHYFESCTGLARRA